MKFYRMRIVKKRSEKRRMIAKFVTTKCYSGALHFNGTHSHTPCIVLSHKKNRADFISPHFTFPQPRGIGKSIVYILTNCWNCIHIVLSHITPNRWHANPKYVYVSYCLESYNEKVRTFLRILYLFVNLNFCILKNGESHKMK